MRFSVRRNVLSGTNSFTLQDNELLITNSKQPKNQRVIPYKNIRSVNLIFTPGYKNTPASYQCTLKSDVEKPVKIISNHFVSLGNFDTKYEEYTNFIRLLHEKLANNPEVRFKKGLNITKFNALVFLFAFLLLALIVIGFAGLFMQKFDVAIPMFLGSIFFGYTFYKLYLAYKPKSYNPDKIPSEMLPNTI